MVTWTGIVVSFVAGIWGTINPEGVLLFMFSKRYEKKNSQPSTLGKLITRIICALTLASSVYLATSKIVSQ